MKSITITEQEHGNFFTFYDNNLGSILRKFEGFEYASVVASIDEVAGNYGAVYVNSKFGTRKLTFQGELTGNDVFTKRRTLLRALRQTGTIKLIKFTTYDDLKLQFEGEVTKYVNSYNHSIHSFLIEVTAPDWRFYSQDIESHDFSQTILSGGGSIPISVPWSIPLNSGGYVDIQNIITNNGDEVSDPVFTIYGPGSGFTISSVTTGDSFTVDYTLGNSDYITIDVKNRTALLNDTTNVYPDVTGTLWSILPGENEIRFFVTSGFDNELTHLNISFRHAYNGI